MGYLPAPSEISLHPMINNTMLNPVYMQHFVQTKHSIKHCFWTGWWVCFVPNYFTSVSHLYTAFPSYIQHLDFLRQHRTILKARFSSYKGHGNCQCNLVVVILMNILKVCQRKTKHSVKHRIKFCYSLNVT